jgi:hypothetical protein
VSSAEPLCRSVILGAIRWIGLVAPERWPGETYPMYQRALNVNTA